MSLVSGCATGRALHTAEPTAKAQPKARQAGPIRVMALHRHTKQPESFALWIDAGSRDADPPQLATVAGLVAAHRAGPGFEALVLPDGTEIHGSCSAADLARCMASLERALSTRHVSADELAAAMRELGKRRRLAAGDEGRLAHQLSLDALFGAKAAAAFFPLGAASSDGAVTARSLASFFERHYGPNRALLATVGSLAPEAVVGGAAHAFGHAPRASSARVKRDLPAAKPSVAVQVGHEDWVAAALPVASQAQGVAVAEGLLDGPMARRLDGIQPPALDASVFRLRGGPLLLVRASHVASPEAMAGNLAFELGRLALQVSPDHPTPPPEDPPAVLARTIGESWVTSGDEGGPEASSSGAKPAPTPTIAIGAVIDGGRADRPDRPDPDAEMRSQAEARLGAELHEALAALSPKIRGTINDDGASVVLVNGARIEVHRRPRQQRVRTSVRILGGAALDPASLHGRTALLATTMAEGCGALGPEGLHVRLRELDASIHPAVSDDAFGVVVDAPVTSWAEALDLALQCVTAPRLDTRAVSSARLALLDALAAQPPFRTWAAQALAPRAPGLIAPWGDHTTLVHVQTGDLTHVWHDAAVGARVGLLIEGEVPVREATERAARLLARLPPGTLPPSAITPAAGTPSAGPLPDGPLTEDWSGDGAAVLVGWRLPPMVDTPTARRLAQTIGHALEKAGSAHLLWSDGGSGRLAWAALAVQMDTDDVPGFATRVDEVMAALAKSDDPTIAKLAATLGSAQRAYVIGRSSSSD